jgi:hypothetical protein
VAADYARRVLTHYLRTAFEAAGLEWDSDNTAEVHAIVDSLVEAARHDPHADDD